MTARSQGIGAGVATGRAEGAAPWAWLAVAAYLAMVAMNALANTLPLFGNTTAEVSRRYPTLFTPAPFTFAVWGAIYAALAAFVVYQALPAQRGDPRLAAARPLFVLSSLLNVAWLAAWHADRIVLSELLMLALLACLIALYRRVQAWLAPASAAQRWLLDVPFSLYLGWISVATVANTSITLVSLGVDAGAAATALTVTVVAVAAALGLAAVVARRDPAFALVVAWGLYGVSAARRGESAAVSGAALALSLLLVAAAAWALARRANARAA